MAASMACSMAQNVYSANVVGYVNVTLPHGQFYAVGNPLDATMGGTIAGANNITNLFSTAAGNIAPSSTITTFDSAAIDWVKPPITFSGKSSTWGSGLEVPPGKAVLYFNNGASDTVVTFVGQVVQGPYTAAVMPGGMFTLASQPVPLGGTAATLNTQLGLVPGPSDTITTFDGVAIDWVKPPAAWSAKSSSWTGTTINLAVAQGFLYFNNAGTANTWTSNFTVQ